MSRTRNERGIHELYANDPFSADLQLWGRRSDPLTRRGFLKQSGLAALGTAMYFEIISPVVCAFAGAAWTLGMFFVSLWRHFANQVMEGDRPASVGTWLKDDRFWAGWLCACAIFMLYYFY